MVAVYPYESKALGLAPWDKRLRAELSCPCLTAVIKLESKFEAKTLLSGKDKAKAISAHERDRLIFVALYQCNPRFFVCQ
jgi:hypothetical protein